MGCLKDLYEEYSIDKQLMTSYSYMKHLPTLAEEFEHESCYYQAFKHIHYQINCFAKHRMEVYSNVFLLGNSCRNKRKETTNRYTTYTSTHTDKRTTIKVGYMVVLTTTTSAYTSMCTVTLHAPATTWVTWTPASTTNLVSRMPRSIKTGNTALFGRTNKDITERKN